ncbi:chondroitinase-B domain-containing protein [Algibacter miyuki]|uniref:Chondroitinase-B domain-containing protein n=1 Tax=Algibacter miyuki TaxID=1306933 RepID=A0ABV5GXH7_9FLAO|nr:chondroitinase-B domain-containing protein [Algibacter miyuki]
MAQTFTDAEDLVDAVNASTNGGTFIVKNGTYNDFEATFEVMATAVTPIIIKAETVGGVTLTGESHFVFKKSAHITLEGFVIDGVGDNSLIKLEGCNNIRITRNIFELVTEESIKWVYIGGVYNDNTKPFVYPSHNNRIDHNIFQNKTTPGHYITIDGTTDSNDVAYQSQYDRIDHNHFKNNGPRAVNEQESIRIGWSEMSQSSGYTIVEFNLFEDCDGDPEIVSIKSSDNTVRHNTFKSSYGTLSFRHGNNNRAEGNYFFGNGKAITTSPDGATLYTGGIRIYGKNQVIINNYMEGLTGTRWDAPITLTLGDAIDGQSSSLSKHFRAENVLIAYNTLVNNSHGIEIGYDNNNAYSKDLENITIANNLITGSENALVEIVDTDNDQGDNITWKNNLFFPKDNAVLLAGATSTSFDMSEVVNENPNIIFDADSGTWKTSATTPLYSNGVTNESISEDIEGQMRPTSSNPGADHFSTESIRYKPLNSTDVGPDAYEIDDTSESLYLSSIAPFPASEASQNVTITSNVDWTVNNSTNWVSVTPTSGSNNGSIEISVLQNPTFSTRSTQITIEGGNISRTLEIIQGPADPKDGLILINDQSSNDNVSIHYVFAEEITDTKNNIAAHSLDKNFDTQWSGKNIDGEPGEIIFDLGGTYNLQLIDYASTNGKRYEFQIWTSTTGTAEADFSNAFPGESNLVCETNNDVFTSYKLPQVAVGTKYVKIIGFGQPDRPSDWNTISEIEFYSTVSLSTSSEPLQTRILLYPVPTKNQLHIKSLDTPVKNIKIYGVDGRLVLNQDVKMTSSEATINTSTLKNGAYIINLTNENSLNHSEIFIISQ